MCAYQGVRNICFLENLACFVFLKHPFWDSTFGLITDDKGICETLRKTFNVPTYKNDTKLSNGYSALKTKQVNL